MFEEGREAMENEDLGSKVKEYICELTTAAVHYKMGVDYEVDKNLWAKSEKELNQLLEYKEKCEQLEKTLASVVELHGKLYDENKELKEKCEEVVETNNRMGDAYLGTLFKIDNLEKQLEKGKSNE